MRDAGRVDRDGAALLLVDIQPDFFPGGALAVAEGDGLLAPVAKLLASNRFGLYVATQDWHPPGHVSFASRHEGKEPMQAIELYGHEQTLWPDHCVQGTPGAALHPDLDWRPLAAVIRKGADPACDSYSGFRNNWNADGKRPPTGLAGYLRERGITRLFVCGLARDVCVKWTAEDGVAAGFEVCFLWDATRSVDPGSDAALERELSQRGVRVGSTEELVL